jgi:hypothetical protein
VLSLSVYVRAQLDHINSYRRVPCIIIRHDITECHASLSLLLHALSTSQLRPHDHNTSYPLYAGGWCPIILRTHTHGGELATEKSVKSGTTYTYVQRLLLVVSRVPSNMRGHTPGPAGWQNKPRVRARHKLPSPRRNQTLHCDDGGRERDKRAAARATRRGRGRPASVCIGAGRVPLYPRGESGRRLCVPGSSRGGPAPHMRRARATAPSASGPFAPHMRRPPKSCCPGASSSRRVPVGFFLVVYGCSDPTRRDKMVGALKSSAGYMASRQYAYLKFIRKRKTRMKNQVYIRRGRRNLLCGLDFFFAPCSKLNSAR